jgi:hypothetical protein
LHNKLHFSFQFIGIEHKADKRAATNKTHCYFSNYKAVFSVIFAPLRKEPGVKNQEPGIIHLILHPALES